MTNPNASDHGGYGSSASCLMTLTKVAAVCCSLALLTAGALIGGLALLAASVDKRQPDPEDYWKDYR